MYIFFRTMVLCKTFLDHYSTFPSLLEQTVHALSLESSSQLQKISIILYLQYSATFFTHLKYMRHTKRYMLIVHCHNYNFVFLCLNYLSLGKFNNSNVSAIFSYDHPPVTPKKMICALALLCIFGVTWATAVRLIVLKHI